MVEHGGGIEHPISCAQWRLPVSRAVHNCYCVPIRAHDAGSLQANVTHFTLVRRPVSLQLLRERY